MYHSLNDFGLNNSRAVVYFMISGDRKYIKIGRTVNLSARLARLRGSSKQDIRLCGVLDNITHRQAVLIETALHHKFKECRCYGEWFEREPVEKYILSQDKVYFPKTWNIRNLYDLKMDAEVFNDI